MTVYLNWKGPNGRETVDEFTRGSDDAPAGGKEFWAYVRRTAIEYHEAGLAVYTSSRPCEGWKIRSDT